MTLSNKLTIFRMVLAPVFFVGLIHSKFLVALILFVLAMLTDFLDGKIARLNNQVTDFGKFLDPIADKILTTFAYLYLLKADLFSIVPVSLIFSREFIVSAIRLIACQKGAVIAANLLGKIKTFFQTVSIFLAIIYLYLTQNLNMRFSFLNVSIWIINFLVWVSALFSVISGLSYVKEYYNTDKIK